MSPIIVSHVIKLSFVDAEKGRVGVTQTDDVRFKPAPLISRRAIDGQYTHREKRLEKKKNCKKKKGRRHASSKTRRAETKNRDSDGGKKKTRKAKIFRNGGTGSAVWDNGINFNRRAIGLARDNNNNRQYFHRNKPRFVRTRFVLAGCEFVKLSFVICNTAMPHRYVYYYVYILMPCPRFLGLFPLQTPTQSPVIESRDNNN